MNYSKDNRNIAAALLGFIVAMILWITVLGRNTNVDNPLVIQSFHSFHFILAEIKKNGIRGNFLGNIVLFIPFGILLPVVSTTAQKWYRTFFGGLTFSMVIETLQFITTRGYFVIDDMILNSFGTLIGYGIYRVVMKGIEKINYSRR